jgi:hypothetical protein
MAFDTKPSRHRSRRVITSGRRRALASQSQKCYVSYSTRMKLNPQEMTDAPFESRRCHCTRFERATTKDPQLFNKIVPDNPPRVHFGNGDSDLGSDHEKCRSPGAPSQSVRHRLHSMILAPKWKWAAPERVSACEPFYTWFSPNFRQQKWQRSFKKYFTRLAKFLGSL